MSTAWQRGIKKALRTLVQLIASGGLTAAVNQFADGLSPNQKAYVLAAWMVLLALLQNGLESAGRIPILLPTPGLVPSTGGLAGRAIGTVDTAVDTAGSTVGEVSGTVESTAGELLGEVDGTFGETDQGDG